MSVYIDVTEFVKHPLASGIQRVTAQICKNWPGDSLVPVRFSGGGLSTLTNSLIRQIGDHFASPSKFPEMSLLSPQAWSGSRVKLNDEDTLLVPELFYDPARVAYYRDLGDRELKRCRFLIYDLIPIEYPEYFPGLRFEVVCPYFQMIRRVPHCAFISEATQRAYYHRLLRVRELKGVVLRLGCDGLGPRPAEVARNKPLMFTVLGRVEPSKNPGIILDAFEPLLREMPNLRLVFLGKIGSISSALVERLERMAADPSSGVQHHSKADDALIRSYVDQSRATIFVSGAEGFGLPPVESLWRGTPVIASARIPSLEKIGETGVHLVEPLTDSALRRAICLFLDDEYSSLKSAETLGLDLPTWRSFTEQVAEWCSPEVT